ncbi:MAG: hypothetical protein CVT64_11400 [Actinobacteria bacterium HGW-Actinobacteria-4]|nr:MAG: hypothetical protein CVT64_11400 [Actinobacteria bacterium HGW-Actinobacteria-4]
MTAAPERFTPAGEQRWNALRQSLSWLTHPVSLISIAVLVVNDHILKDAYGNWWTGKLSDFAGLIFFPALLAVAFAVVAPRAQFRPLGLASVVTTGVGFAWIKATEIGATAASAVWSLVAGPSIILRDPTDFIALPMLAVAVAIAVRVKTRPRAVLATIAVPFAVIATVATGPGTFEPSASMSEDSTGTPIVLVDSGPSYFAGVYRYNGKDWLFDENAPNLHIHKYATTALACVPEIPNECFRPMLEGIGVQRSVDAGETWVTDWQLSTDERDILRGAYVKSDFELTGAFSTNGVAVIPTDRGFRVVASNGYDGLAVRDESGHWQREGWRHVSCCQHLGVANLDGHLHPWQAEGKFRWPAAWAIIAFALGFMALVACSPRSYARPVAAIVGGVILVATGLSLAGTGVYLNFRITERIPTVHSLTPGVVEIQLAVAIGLMVAVGASFFITGAPWSVLRRSLGYAALIAAGVAGAVELSPPVPLVKAVVAGVVLLLGIASGAFLQRSTATRDRLRRVWRRGRELVPRTPGADRTAGRVPK